MSLAVANLAERDAIIDIEPTLGVVGPTLDMMGMQPPHYSAAATCPSVAGHDGIAPDLQFWSRAGTLIGERLATLPVPGVRAYHSASLTGSRAIDAATRIALEGRITDRADQQGRSVTPTRLATPACSGSVRMHFEGRSAPLAYASDFRLRSDHIDSITQTLEPCYVGMFTEATRG